MTGRGPERPGDDNIGDVRVEIEKLRQKQLWGEAEDTHFDHTVENITNAQIRAAKELDAPLGEYQQTLSDPDEYGKIMAIIKERRVNWPAAVQILKKDRERRSQYPDKFRDQETSIRFGLFLPPSFIALRENNTYVNRQITQEHPRRKQPGKTAIAEKFKDPLVRKKRELEYFNKRGSKSKSNPRNAATDQERADAINIEDPPPEIPPDSFEY